MIIRDVNLETVCGVTSKLPDNTLPEFAFAGKSNVGKSSLINALMNRKAYAGRLPSLERRRPLTFTISIKNCIMWIFLDMAMLKFL